ncbi:ferritin-like domain-containing protein [Azotobacter beijerinckii]|uniref:ferritin-like domain-containing protein n=1 Tax=Azotobacter beijerinckii TaxID=170623 RepID=UPI002952B925|nr:ferritin [Azotobacter beijerinckii]MDV7212059.1 ferritin [Azotobacter beijerinckii]
MTNYDEAILRSGRIDPAAPFPVLHQAMRIALHEQYAAQSFHGRVVEAFGPRPPFVGVVRAKERHIAALSALCQRFGIPRPLNPFPQETSVSPSWRANCERGVAGEIATIRLCEYLLTQVGEPDARRLLQSLQTASLEHHLPAFRQAVAEAMAQERYHAARGIPPQEAYVRHGPLSDFMERALAHAGPLGMFSPLLRHSHPAMLAGMVAGGAGIYLLKNRSGRNR